MSAVLKADLLRECDPGVRWQDAHWRWSRVLTALADHPGTWAVLEYRFRRWSRTRPGPLGIALKPVAFLTRRTIEAVTGISINASATIGPGLYIGHMGGIVVGGGVRAGENLNISQGVTIGRHGGSPIIGDQVYLAPGAKVFGAITVGDHVAVGANAVVNRDIPAFSTVVTEVRVLSERGNMRPDCRAAAQSAA